MEPWKTHRGRGQPDDSLGSDGDFYIDLGLDACVGPKRNGAWPSLKGSKQGDDPRITFLMRRPEAKRTWRGK